MIDLNPLAALISFYFVMYVTPGPNNAMVLTSGLKFGFFKTVPHMSGITIGHVLQLSLVCLGLGKIFQIFPQLQNILKIMCSLYLLYLGYKIIGSFSKIKEDDSRPLKFHEAALFQIINPKVITVASSSSAVFIQNKFSYEIEFLLIFVCFVISTSTSAIIWAAIGHSFRNYLNDTKKIIIFNRTMAILLMSCIFFIIL